MTRRFLGSALGLVAALSATTNALAGLIPGGIGAAPGQLIGGVTAPLGRGEPAVGSIVSNLDGARLTEGLDPSTLLDLRRQRLRALVRDNRAALDTDEKGNPVRRGEVIAIDPSPALLAKTQAAGFRTVRQERVGTLGFSLVVLATPKGERAAKALKDLETLDATRRFDLDYVLEPAGGPLGAGGAAAAAPGGGAGAIGMVDGGVAAHPALAGASIEQRGFAQSGVKASGHGTAIASLLVGSDGKFVGAARGRALLVADVYGGRPADGSAEAIVRGLDWLAQRGVKVITISLVGPPNLPMERAVVALQARGVIVVAAVGNDGPAAPPQYPASYPVVIAVTGVDAGDRALLEAGRATHLDFAAPGADMAAALPGRGYAVVRGTSFAAPLVAARLAMTGGGAAQALRAVTAEAIPGKGKVGRGVVCGTCRIDPKSVGAKN